MNFWKKVKDRCKPSRAYLRGYGDGYDNGYNKGLEWAGVIPSSRGQVHSFVKIFSREGVWIVPEKRNEKADHG